MSSARDALHAVSSSNQLNISTVSENKSETARSDELDVEIKINERDVETAFKELQKVKHSVLEGDPLEGNILRKELDSLQHINLLKQQRIEMLAGTVNELNCRLTGNIFPAAEAKTKTTRMQAEDVECKVEAEEILSSQLETIYTRVSQQIAELKVRYTELEDKYKRVSRHYVKTQNTEFVAQNCAAAASTQKALFLKTMQQTRENYRILKQGQQDLKTQLKVDALRSLERMSASTLANREKISRKRNLNAAIQTAIESHQLHGGQKKKSQEELEYFYGLLAQIQGPLSKYGLVMDLQSEMTEQQACALIGIYKQSIHEEASLKIRFQELSQSAIEKRNECDSIRADLEVLQADDLIETSQKNYTVSTNLLDDKLESAENSTTKLELVAGKEDTIMRIYFRLQESIRTSLSCLSAIEMQIPIKREIRLVCDQLQNALAAKPKASSDLRILVPAKKTLYRSKSSVNTSRASTSTPTFSTEINSEETRFNMKTRGESLTRSPTLHQYIRSVYADNNKFIEREARELEKSNFISYFGDIEKVLTSEVAYESAALLYAKVIEDASGNIKDNLSTLTEYGANLLKLLKHHNSLLKSRVETSVKSKMPDKFIKVKEDLDCIEEDVGLYTFKKKSFLGKQPSLPLNRKRAKSCETSFEEVEEMPKILKSLKACKTELKWKLEADAAKKLNPKSLRKIKTGEHRYASLPPSELKSVIQEVKFYDSAIKALYSTEKKAKMKLPLQAKPLLSRKIRISSSKAQLSTMRNLAGLPLPKSRISQYSM